MYVFVVGAVCVLRRVGGGHGAAVLVGRGVCGGRGWRGTELLSLWRGLSLMAATAPAYGNCGNGPADDTCAGSVGLEAWEQSLDGESNAWEQTAKHRANRGSAIERR